MRHRILIVRCEAYDPARIRSIVREGMEELGVRPGGNVLLKPNVVIAHADLFPHAFTRKEFLDGVIGATKDRAVNLAELAVGERCALTVPTRFAFTNAGYPEVLKKHRIKAIYFDEVRQAPVELRADGRLRDRIYVPEPVLEADFLINLPKFKAHPWSRLTLSLKNFIGLQDDRHRLVDHNIFLEHKIADLQEVIQPKFIAVDGIVAGQRMMLTPKPFPMGAIVMGTNSCAVDTVGCHMVHLDPESVVHLRLASERGLGPIHLEEIDVGGDFPLEEVRERTRGFEFCTERIDEYFGKNSNLSCTVGTFPEEHARDYCRGGCPGALQEAMHIIRAYYPDVDRQMKKVRFVVGHVDRPLALEQDERVIFAGDCARWEGEIRGRPVKIESSYRRPCWADGHKPPSNDLLLKTFLTLRNCFRQRKSAYVRAKGCTVSIADLIHYISAVGEVGNVNFDPRLVLPLNAAYWQMRFKRFLNHLMG